MGRSYKENTTILLTTSKARIVCLCEERTCAATRIAAANKKRCSTAHRHHPGVSFDLSALSKYNSFANFVQHVFGVIDKTACLIESVLPEMQAETGQQC